MKTWKKFTAWLRAYWAKVMKWGQEIRDDEYGTEPEPQKPSTPERPCKLGKCPCAAACDEEGHCLSAWSNMSGEK